MQSTVALPMTVFPLELQSDINFNVVFISQKVFSDGNHIQSLEIRAL